MASNGIVRRIDDIGRIVIPKEIRRNMNIKEGDALEVIVQHNYNSKDNEIVIRKYRKSFEECAIDWFKKNEPLLNSHCRFQFDQQYTFCVVYFPYEPSRAGFAKRHTDDVHDTRIGKVAAYANAMGENLNKMIGYEG